MTYKQTWTVLLSVSCRLECDLGAPLHIRALLKGDPQKYLPDATRHERQWQHRRSQSLEVTYRAVSSDVQTQRREGRFRLVCPELARAYKRQRLHSRGPSTHSTESQCPTTGASPLHSHRQRHRGSHSQQAAGPHRAETHQTLTPTICPTHRSDLSSTSRAYGVRCSAYHTAC